MNVKAVASVVSQVANLLKGPALFTFHVYVKQAIVFGIEDLLYVALFLTLIYLDTLLIRFISKKLRDDYNKWIKKIGEDHISYYNGDDGLQITLIFNYLACAGLIIATLIFGFHAISNLLNPQWSAINMLLNG